MKGNIVDTIVIAANLPCIYIESYKSRILRYIEISKALLLKCPKNGRVSENHNCPIRMALP